MRSNPEGVCAMDGVIRIRHINNLAANLERSPLTYSAGFSSAGDRSTLFAGTPDRRFPLSFVPFMQFAG